jgi:lysophospholipase L1-like esterase
MMKSSTKEINLQLLTLTALLSIFVFFLSIVQKPQKVYPAQGFFPTITPTPFNPFPYKIPKVPYSRAYRTMLVGDSMVAALGLNAQALRLRLKELYPDHEFVNYNYGFSATSIETLPERLTKNVSYNGQDFPAILSQGFDLIIIESFAYNPLSQLAEGEGITRHIQVLDESIRQIIKEHPEAVLAILVTIAPSKTLFATGVYDLSPEERIQWAEERISYIEAVIEYAEEKQIPLINVYEKSLTPSGDGDLRYINQDDYIHPSNEGVDLISKTIAEFIFTNRFFPE